MTRGAFALAVLLTLIVGFYLVERARGNTAWERYQAEARARGTKLSLMEYVPAPVPDERNYAAIPLFQDAFRQPQPPNPLALPEAEGVKQPAVSKGEFIDLAAWQKYFVETKALPAAGENAATDVLKALERYAPQLEQLRLAGARPECRFPVRWEDGVGAMLPHLQLIQSAARIYSLRLSAHLALGQGDAAYEDFRSGLRLYTALVKEPSLISGLVRLATLNILENAVCAGLARHQWMDAELQKITADLAGVRLLDDYALGLGSERGFSNMVHDQLATKGPRELADFFALLLSEGSQKPSAARYFFSLYPIGWVRLSQTRANRYFDEALTRISQEPPRIFPERTASNLPAKMSDVGSYERLQYLLYLTLAPALQEVERSYAYGQTLLDQTRTGCALERYRLAHGSFPVSIEALTPAFLASLPQDVMNGTPLHYRTNADGGYTLYSVAWNLKDDGGRLDAKDSAKQQPDWVWTVPGK